MTIRQGTLLERMEGHWGEGEGPGGCQGAGPYAK